MIYKVKKFIQPYTVDPQPRTTLFIFLKAHRNLKTILQTRIKVFGILHHFKNSNFVEYKKKFLFETIFVEHINGFVKYVNGSLNM